MSFNPDITLNSNVAVTAGSNTPHAFSRISTVGAESVWSAPSVALTNPEQLKIGHSVRKISALSLSADASKTGPPVLVDRHLVRFDWNQVQTKYNDPDSKLNASIQLVVETPRLGADSPTTSEVSDMIQGIAAFLINSSNANLIKLLNREV